MQYRYLPPIGRRLKESHECAEKSSGYYAPVPIEALGSAMVAAELMRAPPRADQLDGSPGENGKHCACGASQ